ncbi:hypothetical protein ACFP2T_31350 [Plantactinospora solaniradicis]|uniref:ATP-binding protein n=1 Tax=Plantactinospora solaniradicis TaxID=1723736 RepID=A0ABW1KFW0_9ACTN
MAQNVFALAGFAYGTVYGDIHILGDGRPMYTIEVHRPRETPPTSWLLDLPSRLLDARHEVVPFIGRERELVDLTQWRDDGARLSVLFLHGPGGQGKSRLAHAFAERSARDGWKVAYARHGGDTLTAPEDSQDVGTGDSPGLLLVVDYADRWPHAHLEWLLRNRLLHTPVPTRVLLIGRSTHGWPAVQHALEEVYATTRDLALAPLATDPDGRSASFAAAAVRYRELLGVEGAGPDVPHAVRHDAAFELVLAQHMAALVAVDAKRRGARAPTDPVGLSAYLLRREHAHWARLHSRVEQGGTLRTPPTAMALASFVAALTGQLPTAVAQSLLATAADWPVTAAQLVADHAVCYPPAPGMALQPMYPDRLAEDFLAMTLPGHGYPGYPPDGHAADVVALLLARGPDAGLPSYLPRAMVFLASTAQRWPHVADRLAGVVSGDPALAVAAGGAALSALAQVPEMPTEVLEGIEPLIPEASDVDFDAGPADVVAVLTERRLATTDNPVIRAELYAVSGRREHLAGRQPEAVARLRRTVEIYRELAESAPGVHDLARAKALSYLSVVLTGQPREAMRPAKAAVDILRPLAERVPDDRDVAVTYAQALSSWAVASVDDDSLAGAAAAMYDNVPALRRMADRLPDDPEVLRSLANALSNSAVWQAVNGDGEAAEQLSDEGLGVARRLAGLDFAEWGVLEALVLNGRFLVLQLLEREREAVPVARAIVDVVRRLAAVRPAAYELELAKALTRAAALHADLRLGSEALAFNEEAEQLLRELVARQAMPEFQHYLAMAVANRAAVLRVLGRDEDAVTAADEAVRIHQELTAVTGHRFEEGQATTIGIYAGLAAADGRLAEAVPQLKQLFDMRMAAPLRGLPDQRALADLHQATQYLYAGMHAAGRDDEILAMTHAYLREIEANPFSRMMAKTMFQDPAMQAEFKRLGGEDLWAPRWRQVLARLRRKARGFRDPAMLRGLVPSFRVQMSLLGALTLGTGTGVWALLTDHAPRRALGLAAVAAAGWLVFDLFRPRP